MPKPQDPYCPKTVRRNCGAIASFDILTQAASESGISGNTHDLGSSPKQSSAPLTALSATDKGSNHLGSSDDDVSSELYLSVCFISNITKSYCSNVTKKKKKRLVICAKTWTIFSQTN